MICDQSIELTGQKSRKETLAPLRRIAYRDPESGQRYVFITNHFALAASTIAACYKQRWQIELFFKWIKQNLKIKAFLGTSKNAVMTQIWIALCMYLMLAYLKYLSKISVSMQHMIRLLQLNLFARRDLTDLLRGAPPDPEPPNPASAVGVRMKFMGQQWVRPQLFLLSVRRWQMFVCDFRRGASAVPFNTSSIRNW